MSTIRKHKKRIMGNLVSLRSEIMICFEHGHVRYPPKRLRDFELDIDALMMEIERTDFVERSKK